MVAAKQPGSRSKQKAATRQALLAAARAVLQQQGLEGTTVRLIAREAGVAVGTVFVHFPDLSALIETLLDEHLAQALERAAATAPPPHTALVERLVHTCRCLYDSYGEEPELSRAYLSASLFGASRVGLADQRLLAFQQDLLAQVRAAVARGEIPPIDDALAFSGFFSLYFGLLVAGLRDSLPREPQVALLRAALARFFQTEVSTCAS